MYFVSNDKGQIQPIYWLFLYLLNYTSTSTCSLSNQGLIMWIHPSQRRSYSGFDEPRTPTFRGSMPQSTYDIKEQVVKKFWWEAALQRWRIFLAGKLMRHRSVGRIVVGCSSRADAIICFLYTPQQWLAMLFDGQDNPQNRPFPWVIWTPM